MHPRGQRVGQIQTIGFIANLQIDQSPIAHPSAQTTKLKLVVCQRFTAEVNRNKPIVVWIIELPIDT
jgi:hypothetical protein